MTTSTVSTVSRPRLGAGLIVLLALVTLANLLGLALTVMAWVDATSHGADLGDGELTAAVAGVLLSVAALVGLGGAWFRRKWGVRIYFGAQLIGFVILLGYGAVGPMTFVPLVLAGALWWVGERDW